MTVVTTIEDLTEAWLAHLSVARDPAMITFDQQDRPWIVWETEDGDMCAASYPSEDDPHIVPGERVHPPLVDAETLLPLQVPLTGPQRPLVSLSDEDLEERIRFVLSKKFLHGQVLPAYVGSETDARVSALRSIIDLELQARSRTHRVRPITWKDEDD